MRYISADLIITNDGPPLQKHMIVLDGSRIVDIGPVHSDVPVEFYKGIITPGFVNAHCHLELSHLKGAIPPGTGLIEFIKGVVSLREYPKDTIYESAGRADKEMWENGIVAVGDICNKTDTIGVKQNSPVRYYNFVESFDFLQAHKASQVFKEAKEVYDQFEKYFGPGSVSMVPHAPYSVSPELFALINAHNAGSKKILSIHNQELLAEDELFLRKTGGFVEFYQSIGISLDHFVATGDTSVAYCLDHIDAPHPLLLVHNTMSGRDDIERVQQKSASIYWVTCPNANLYIEGRLPDYDKFINAGADICIGTDSLSSNWSLSIISEMQAISKHRSDISALEIIKWGTINGAKALGMDDELGILSAGRSPGINWIATKVHADGSFSLNEAALVKKLA